jgi:hypothetical protein
VNKELIEITKCKYCGLEGMRLWSCQPRMASRETIEKIEQSQIELTSALCPCRKVVHGINIFKRQENLTNDEIFWFKSILLETCCNFLNYNTIELMDNPTENNLAIIKFYRDSYDEVEKIAGQKRND